MSGSQNKREKYLKSTRWIRSIFLNTLWILRQKFCWKIFMQIDCEDRILEQTIKILVFSQWGIVDNLFVENDFSSHFSLYSTLASISLLSPLSLYLPRSLALFLFPSVSAIYLSLFISIAFTVDLPASSFLSHRF